MDVEQGLGNNQAYEARGVVGRIQKIGNIQVGLIHTPVYKFLTMDCGIGQKGKCVKFVSPAPRVIDELTGEEYLDLQAVKDGDIVVSPGLLYTKVEWTDALYAEHLFALKTYRRKDILIHEAPDEADQGIDLGSLNMAQDDETKSAIAKSLKETIN